MSNKLWLNHFSYRAFACEVPRRQTYWIVNAGRTQCQPYHSPIRNTFFLILASFCSLIPSNSLTGHLSGFRRYSRMANRSGSRRIITGIYRWRLWDSNATSVPSLPNNQRSFPERRFRFRHSKDSQNPGPRFHKPSGEPGRTGPNPAVTC